VPEPLEVPQALALAPEQHASSETLTEVLEAMPNLYKTLPVQTIHADYLSFNILLSENQVVGV